LLIASGIIGIGLGDTFYFGGMSKIGARNALLIEILAPIFTGIF